MDAITKNKPITSIVECFAELNDPRVEGRTLHKLIDIIVLSICAVICGANGWKEIEAFGYAKYKWLKRFLEFPHGIPSHQTIGRVFSLLPACQFHDCFIKWVNWTAKKTQREVIAIDGKTARRSHARSRGQKALHLVNAFATANGIVIGNYPTEEKSNEIKTIPPLLKSLEISGCIVTIDAMGTQKGIANLIRLKDADYVLAVKRNQGRLHKKITSLFEKAQSLNFNAMVYKEKKTVDGDHGRVEERIYTVLPLMYLHGFKKTWRDLKIFIRVESCIHQNGKDEKMTRYYISSISFKEANQAIFAIRKHWHVENRLHWCLDVVFREDDSRVRRGYAARNLATLRQLVLNLLRDNASFKAGLTMARLYAGWNNQFLQQVVGL